jgi:hypothetical protein
VINHLLFPLPDIRREQSIAELLDYESLRDDSSSTI